MSHVACWEFDSYVELSLRAKRGICCCLRLERRLGKKQIPHGLKAVRDDNSEIAQPDITCAALNSPRGTCFSIRLVQQLHHVHYSGVQASAFGPCAELQHTAHIRGGHDLRSEEHTSEPS